MPIFLPQGDLIAYLVNSGDLDTQHFYPSAHSFLQGWQLSLSKFEN
jgi:hypothetical protein